MIVQLHQITDSSSTFNFILSEKDSSKFEERFSFNQIECHADLKQNREHINLRGQFKVDIKTPCDFCLSPAELKLDKEFEIELIADQSMNSEPVGDLEIPLHGIDTESFNGHEINLAAIYEDQVLLELPLSIKCKKDCKGVCSSCGVNLNQDSCKCEIDIKDNPFAILGQLEL
ncbi:MAG: DUF177 domain-containing protein [Proteobacteria bacterium]|nr:DUF177 domain-containing protein [Pseudomonadota bacterium]